MSELALALLGTVVAVALFLGIFVWEQRRSQELLQQWAAKHGYSIVSREPRYWRLGPFSGSTSMYQRYQRVFYVRIHNPGGKNAAAG
ncbi:hypothetical protein [Synechococcus sp. H65.1]|uniref:hypothetical protein n=1 Tax=unclassified Synechococcus TaxID=2626047 RepID=UPI0039C25112